MIWRIVNVVALIAKTTIHTVRVVITHLVNHLVKQYQEATNAENVEPPFMADTITA